MGKTFDHITEDLHRFITQQHLFFVASAPLAGDGHVNLSPKGMDTFRIFGPNRVGYLDITGSGNETSAHLAENGRITFMFCAFEGPPNIVRLYGAGQTIVRDAQGWDNLAAHFPQHPGARQIIIADIHRVSSSCGYAVPFLAYQGERETLSKYWQAKGEDALPDYWDAKNTASIDGLCTPLGETLRTTEPADD